MTRRRIALMVAAVIGLAVVIGVGTWKVGRTPPSHDMHLRYRVALDVPPVEAALWFADRYPEYFTSGEDGLDPWLASLPANERDFVLAMAQTLTWAWVEHERALLVGLEFDALGEAAVTVIRDKTLNQVEIDTRPFPELELGAYFGDATFGAGVFARAVRGLSNCEGQNHLLALLLEAGLGPAIQVRMAGLRNGHELVRLDGGALGQPVFVDAWSNVGPFTAEAVGRVSVLDPDRVGFELQPEAEYLGSRTTVVRLAPARDAPTKPTSLTIRAPSLDPDQLVRGEDPWRVYLFARVLHLYDDPRAESVYRVLLARHCQRADERRTYPCVATDALLERLRSAAHSPG